MIQAIQISKQLKFQLRFSQVCYSIFNFLNIMKENGEKSKSIHGVSIRVGNFLYFRKRRLKTQLLNVHGSNVQNTLI